MMLSPIKFYINNIGHTIVVVASIVTILLINAISCAIAQEHESIPQDLQSQKVIEAVQKLLNSVNPPSTNSDKPSPPLGQGAAALEGQDKWKAIDKMLNQLPANSELRTMLTDMVSSFKKYSTDLNEAGGESIK